MQAKVAIKKQSRAREGRRFAAPLPVSVAYALSFSFWLQAPGNKTS